MSDVAPLGPEFGQHVAQLTGELVTTQPADGSGRVFGAMVGIKGTPTKAA